MKLSLSEANKDICAWLFLTLSFYLVLEHAPFFAAKWVLNKTASDLLGPYIAYAVSWAIIAPLVWWLRKWEERGVPARRMAHGWGVTMVLFILALMFAVYYSGIHLHLMDPKDEVVSFIVGGSVWLSRLLLSRVSPRVRCDFIESAWLFCKLIEGEC